MPNLIKNNQITVDAWEVVAKDEVATNNDQIFLPLAQIDDVKTLITSGKQAGVWLDSDTDYEQLTAISKNVSVIAINFPKFADGRGYSLARILRDQCKYTGELRAIGDVLLDQVFFMSRVGFDAYSLRDDKDAQKVQAMLETFSESYQTSVDQPIPLFKRRG
ncbi:MAG: DUF934 domain-containing protein [Saccharospirillaceae bacterium]|nr:DUF934 domain-containing protein [Pseudomonadales bacterium]NRB80032.1 DUF934 domain-containing protein [Saccharospirillaceae bacterium]